MPTAEVPAALIEPARGGVDQTSRIRAAHEPLRAPGVELPPALVEGHPHDNARMAAQVADHARQLAHEPPAPRGPAPPRPTAEDGPTVRERQPQRLHGPRGPDPQGRHAPRDHVLNHHETEPVAQVVEAAGLDLDVNAHGVEPHAPERGQIVQERRLVRGSHARLRPVALGQGGVDEDGLPIEQHAPAGPAAAPARQAPRTPPAPPVRTARARGRIGERHGAQGRPRAHLVPARADREAVQGGGVGGPGQRVGDVHAVPGARGARGAQAPAVGQIDLDLEGSAPGALDAHPQAEPRQIRLGPDVHRLDRRAGQRLHPHAAPDARGGRVPDGPGVQGLLAPLDAAGVGRVGDLEAQLDGVAVRVGHIDVEGQVAARVARGGAPVDHDLALVVHGAEVDADPLPPPRGRDGDGAAVVEALVGQQGAGDAGGGRLHGEGHEDGPPLAGRGPGGVGRDDRALPPPVEALPSGALHHGVGVLGQGDARQVPPPGCAQPVGLHAILALVPGRAAASARPLVCEPFYTAVRRASARVPAPRRRAPSTRRRTLPADRAGPGRLAAGPGEGAFEGEEGP